MMNRFILGLISAAIAIAAAFGAQGAVKFPRKLPEYSYDGSLRGGSEVGVGEKVLAHEETAKSADDKDDEEIWGWCAMNEEKPPRKLCGSDEYGFETREELTDAASGGEDDEEIWGWCAMNGEKPQRKLCGGSESEEELLCSAREIYDVLTPELIAMYEREISGKKILSDMSEKRLQRSAEKLGISISKMRAVILLQDLASRSGKNVSVSELAAMNEFKFIGYVKTCADDYLATLPEERQQELKQMLKDALKS